MLIHHTTTTPFLRTTRGKWTINSVVAQIKFFNTAQPSIFLNRPAQIIIADVPIWFEELGCSSRGSGVSTTKKQTIIKKRVYKYDGYALLQGSLAFGIVPVNEFEDKSLKDQKKWLKRNLKEFKKEVSNITLRPNLSFLQIDEGSYHWGSCQKNLYFYAMVRKNLSGIELQKRMFVHIQQEIDFPDFCWNGPIEAILMQISKCKKTWEHRKEKSVKNFLTCGGEKSIFQFRWGLNHLSNCDPNTLKKKKNEWIIFKKTNFRKNQKITIVVAVWVVQFEMEYSHSISCDGRL